MKLIKMPKINEKITSVIFMGFVIIASSYYNLMYVVASLGFISTLVLASKFKLIHSKVGEYITRKGIGNTMVPKYITICILVAPTVILAEGIIRNKCGSLVINLMCALQFILVTVCASILIYAKDEINISSNK